MEWIHHRFKVTKHAINLLRNTSALRARGVLKRLATGMVMGKRKKMTL